MRGKDCRAARLCGGPGITPAHAGKRLSPLYPIPPGWDHPRTCGEKTDVTSSVVFRSGSPPHMLGKASPFHFHFSFIGITPAHAGKSTLFFMDSFGFWDHPRTCGEKTHVTIAGVSKKGSPPHMRGKAYSERYRDALEGITPAHAGKRLDPKEMRKIYRDHPRTCGEKNASHANDKANLGSPPHMRGKVYMETLPIYQSGITPAHAGKR